MPRFGLILLAALALPAQAADLQAADLQQSRRLTGRFVAACEDLGQFCFADACGRDQIEAALNCRALCPSSVVLSVRPAACAVPPPTPRIVRRRRG
ncbi:hypothetical protein [Methylobacterium trifolii]|uniref:DUF3551 domain-containing protein n=1 Tax=Methylobacterium trifolii TaxID=1003092 RepID=A0ABQ4U5X5_9HYPH|nr:hypothetical protein [Methylobacterium trifolii]GJE61235.1 hypothetical protein MPOCJGCO_3356 [Methylobacterium trifolii]